MGYSDQLLKCSRSRSKNKNANATIIIIIIINKDSSMQGQRSEVKVVSSMILIDSDSDSNCKTFSLSAQKMIKKVVGKYWYWRGAGVRVDVRRGRPIGVPVTSECNINIEWCLLSE